MFGRILQYGKTLFSAITKHNTGVLAAVVAYFGFSSMIPLLLLVIYVGSLVVPVSDLDRFLTEFAQAYIPTLPSYKELVLQNIARFEQTRGSIRLIGIVGMMWTTVGGFVSLQYILDVIWGIRHRRSFLRQYVVGLGTLAFLLALTAASALVIALEPTVLSILSPGKNFPLQSWAILTNWIAQLAFPAFLLITCYFCYRFLPSKALPQRLLWLGAGLATLGIYLSHVFFVVYTKHLGNYTVIYGTLAFIMLLLFWIYIISAIVLFTGEIIVSLDNQNCPRKEAGKEASNMTSGIRGKA